MKKEPSKNTSEKIHYLKMLDQFIQTSEEKIRTERPSGLSLFGLYSHVDFSERDYLKAAKALKKAIQVQSNLSELRFEHPALLSHRKLKTIFYALARFSHQTHLRPKK